MSWQHLNQPQGWIGVISLSLSLRSCTAQCLPYTCFVRCGLLEGSFPCVLDHLVRRAALSRASWFPSSLLLLRLAYLHAISPQRKITDV